MDIFLITYDIPDDRRRTKIANLLEDYGLRVQYSVFEVWLDKAGRRALMNRLNRLMKPEEDSVRLYPLCSMCVERVKVLGLGPQPQAPGLQII